MLDLLILLRCLQRHLVFEHIHSRQEVHILDQLAQQERKIPEVGWEYLDEASLMHHKWSMYCYLNRDM